MELIKAGQIEKNQMSPTLFSFLIVIVKSK